MAGQLGSSWARTNLYAGCDTGDMVVELLDQSWNTALTQVTVPPKDVPKILESCFVFALVSWLPQQW